jgi:protoheme IX farnesyltransferase
MNSHAPSVDARAAQAVLFGDVVALAKPRITLMVVLTTLGGLFMAPEAVTGSTVLWTVLGTSLIVAGANALNMFLERDIDRYMTRTADRPLPSGRMAPWVALVFGVAFSVAAIPVLAFGANAMTALLAVIANLSYVFLYTPLKQRSWIAVLVGAVPGAMPPLMGWTAATGELTLPGLALFSILFFWQIPHFHAIAFFRKDEYARAGLKVLPSQHGELTTKRHIVLTTAFLVGISLAPHALGLVSARYLFAAVALGAVFFGWAVAGLRRDATTRWARSFFGVSMPYLVLIFASLLLTRLPLARMGSKTLRVAGLVRRYGERVAVDGVSFEVERGEAFGVLGPNGAGKTTAFHVLAGLLPAHAGDIFRDEVKVDPRSPAYRARLGVVFQVPSLDPQLSARENLELAAALYAVPRKIATERAMKLLDLVGLADRAADRVSTLSGGMRRRVELARVLMHDPDLLLLDEPTTGLDVAAARRMWAKLLELRREANATVVMTTHNPDEAALCDRILLLDRGKRLAEGTPAELCRRIGGDVVTVEAENAESLAADISARFDTKTQVVDGRIVFEKVGAHELLPRLVEAFPGKLKSISMRPPTLGDVFVQIAGRTLDEGGASA